MTELTFEKQAVLDLAVSQLRVDDIEIAGDACKALFDELLPTARGIASGILQHETDTEEAVQDALVRILWEQRLQLPDRITDYEGLAKYAMTAVRNESNRILRDCRGARGRKGEEGKRSIYIDLVDLNDTESESANAEIARQVHGLESPICHVRKTDLQDTLDKAMATLTDKEKAVIELYHLRNFDMTHVGEILGLSPAPLYKVMKKGLLKMRSALEGLGIHCAEDYFTQSV